jgi:chromosome segregation ATPase
VLQTETEKSSAKHLSTIMGLEEQLAHAQDSLTKIADRLKETEVELSSVHGDLRSLQNSSARDSSSLAAQLKDAQSRLEELRESSSRAEEEHSAAREAFRQELHKAESEGKHLRDVLRKERDLLEKLMRDQSGKDSEHTEQRQRIEDQASRRELALQTRLQSTEKELDALRRSSVPETQLRKLQVQFDSEREQFERRLETALQDACRAQQQKTVGLRELEQQRLALSSEVDIAGSKIRSLEVKLQEAEEACASERKARLLVADQLRVYKGEGSLQRAGDDRRLTKVAQAAMESVGNAVHIFETIEKGLMNPVANSLDGQQRSALGIAVVDSIVEETIPGSPAAVCGLISAGDEIVAVNGKAVQGSGVAAALRGDDMIGGVVSVTVRKRSSELLEVHLPRADIAVVSGRRQLCDDLAEFSVQAVQAAQAHQPEVLSNRLENILASMKALEQLDVTVQYKLSMQVAELTKGFHEAIKSAFRGIEQVDHVHQQAHALQEQTEEDLRAKLAQRDATMDNANGPTMGAQASEVSGLHAENQSLGRDFRQVQNELKARNMQLADCKRDTDRLREALLMAEEKAAMFEEGQKAMRGTLSAMEEELADAVAEFVEFSFAIAVGINLLWDENMRDAASRRTFDSQLTEDVAWALRIPKNAVSSICYHREDDQVVVVLKLCNVIPPGGTMQNGLRTSRALADEFEQQILDMNSQLRRRPLGAYTKDCTLLGPVSEMTVKAINMSRLDEERDADWRQDEVLRLREQLKRAEDRAKQASELNSKEEEARRLENLDLDLSHKKSQATQEEAQHQAMVAQQNLLRQHQVELTELKRKHKLDLEDWERAMKTKDYEISVLKEQMVSDEIRNSAFKSEKDKGFEFARSVQDAYHKLQMASAQMRDLMKPEINACINTLNNVESEMAFFNAHQVRVLQIATSMSGTSLEDTPLCKDQADAAKSKELVQHDIDALRKQLEALAELTAANGELASQFKLPRLASTAHMTPSRAGERCASGGETPVPVSPVFQSASRRLALGDNEAFAVSGAVVALQNVPTAELEGNHVSMAVSLLPASADPNAFEHILPGSSDLSPRRSFIPFMGNTPRRGKTGKQLTFITPQHRTASMQIQGSSWSWLPEQFCLGEQHRLQAADFSSGGEQEGSQGPRRDAMSLDGGMATLLVTLMAGGDGEVPRAYARCVVTVMSGDDVDKVGQSACFRC